MFFPSVANGHRVERRAVRVGGRDRVRVRVMVMVRVRVRVRVRVGVRVGRVGRVRVRVRRVGRLQHVPPLGRQWARR